MPDITAKIRAKGLDATGVTEDVANQLFAKKGTYGMAIVEYRVDETHEKADGTRKVDLVLTQVEPSVSDDMDEHLREIARTCHYNRGNGDQPTLPQGTDEPTVEGVLAAGAKHKPHPFLPVDAADDNGICDVCGVVESANPAHEVASDEVEKRATDQGDDWEYTEGQGKTADPVPDPFAVST